MTFIHIIYLLALTTHPAHAQSSWTDYTMPRALPLIKNYNPTDYLVTQFYPFGWSRDGKFAFIQKTDIEGRGGSIEQFIILNTVTDRSVWFRSFDSVFDFEKGKERGEVYDDFRKAMFKAGIRQSSVTIDKPPVRLDGDTISFQLDLEKRKFPAQTDEIDKAIKGYYDSFTLYARSRQRGKKIITRQKTGIEIEIYVLGYIRSPFEDRVLVIVTHISRGWEGPPNPVDIQLFGCHLTVGYK